MRRDHQRHPQWVSNLLKRHYLKDDPQLASEIKTHHCLFGTHLVKTHPQPLPVWRGVVTGVRGGFPVAVVEAEKTAVILSAHYPEYLWLRAVEIALKTFGERKRIFITVRREADRKAQSYHGKKSWVVFTQRRYSEEIASRMGLSLCR